jgi:hypothetical protein
MVHDLGGGKDQDLVQGLRGGKEAGSGAGSILKVWNQDRTLSERRLEAQDLLKVLRKDKYKKLVQGQKRNSNMKDKYIKISGEIVFYCFILP